MRHYTSIKDLGDEIEAADKAAINSIISAVNTATGLTIASIA